MTKRIAELQKTKKEAILKMRTLVRSAEDGKWDLTPKERTDFAELEDNLSRISRELEDITLSKGEAVWTGAEAAAALRGGFTRQPAYVPFQPLTRSQSVVDWARYKYGDALREHEDITLGDVCRAMALGPRTDQERRTLSAGTDASGGYTVPTLLSADLIDRLREEAKVFAAGAATLPLDGFKNNYATIATDPTATWKAENSVLNTTTFTFGQVQFAPKTLMVIVPASRELVEDSVNLDIAIRRAFTGAMSDAIDQAVLSSTGGSAPLGILNSTNISTVTAGSTNGWLISNYVPLVTAYEQTLTNNSPANAVIMATRDYGDLAGLRDSTGQPLQRPSVLADLPMIPSNRMPTNETYQSSTTCSSMLFGQWSDCVVGMRTDFRLEVLKERYAEYFQYGFLGVMRLDMKLFQPKSFTRLQGITPSGST